MAHPKFLQQIAEHYSDALRQGKLADTTFIFPNKRSALFLKHYFQQQIDGGAALMPRFTTFQRFANNVCGLPEASRFEQLFMLYNEYEAKMREVNPEAANSLQFDKFIFWGDMILDDFDTIDSSLADASKLYANLKSLEELKSDYLTDEQKKIIERYWGPTNMTGHIEGFWMHIASSKKKDMGRKFVALWELLGSVYESFTSLLESNGEATKGMQLRKAAAKIKETSLEELARRKYVFVGHADLSNAELLIMERLKDARCAEFFWDTALPYFYNDDKAGHTNLAIRFLSKMKANFPMPEGVIKPVKEGGRIDIIGVPSAVLQTKIAGEIIKEMNLDEERAFDTAVVVPDASQLMSLILSLPEQTHGINITLGLPYNATTFSTLFNAILKMQRHSRKSSDGCRTYFYDDILEILLHPHIQIIAGVEANLIRQYINEKKMYNIKAEMLIEHFPALAFIFTPLNDKGGAQYENDIESSSQYIENLIAGLKAGLSAKKGFKSSFECETLDFFAEKIEDLKQLIAKYAIVMKETTFLSFFERVMMSKTINMEGSPLKGLQVMGVLETRCLDFDNILYLSMNEKTLPKRDYVRTMIPNSLRHGYGLPTIEHTESFYSYYFFRSISRASRTTLLYDTRQPGKGRGEISRYLEQLIYVHNNGKVTHKTVDISGVTHQPRSISVQKTDEVMKKLEKYRKPDSGIRISASALKTYMTCPLKFYLEYVNGIREDNPPTDYISPASLGDIQHRAVQRIYDKYAGIPITSDIINEIIANNEIEKALIAELAIEFNDDPATTTIEDLSTEARFILINLKTQTEEMFKAEQNLYCVNGGTFTYLAGELNVSTPQWTVGKHTFNFNMKIDRVDKLDEGKLLFIDYKTGTDELDAGKQLEDIVADGKEKPAIFQLLTYAMAYEDLAAKAMKEGKIPEWLRKCGKPSDIDYKIYSFRTLMQTGQLPPITLNGQPIPPLSLTRKEFEPIIEKIIDDIFNDTTPFAQCENAAKCRHCHFTSVCGRNIPPLRNRS